MRIFFTLLIAFTFIGFAHAQAEYIGKWQYAQQSAKFLYIQDKNECLSVDKLTEESSRCHWSEIQGDLEIYFYKSGEADVFHYRADTDAIYFRTDIKWIRANGGENLQKYIGEWNGMDGGKIVFKTDYTCVLSTTNGDKNGTWSADYTNLHTVIDGINTEMIFESDSIGDKSLTAVDGSAHYHKNTE